MLQVFNYKVFGGFPYMDMNSVIDWKRIPESEFIHSNGFQGMNFGAGGSYSVFLSVDKNSKGYKDIINDNGTILYEGHDVKGDNKKIQDQPLQNSDGTQSENGKFIDAWRKFQRGEREPAVIKVYRKIEKGIWVNLGFYELIGVTKDPKAIRIVYRFCLKPINFDPQKATNIELPHDRKIPGHVMKEVYERDEGKCVVCGEKDNLHYDHKLPFSKGGASDDAKNIQLLCSRHNLEKGDALIY